MGTRRRAREAALKILYQLDRSGGDPEGALNAYWNEHPMSEGVRQYAERLVRTTWKEREDFDTAIARLSEHWALRRMGAVDRTILRFAACELLLFKDIPSKVAINEAVDLAKKYGTQDSPAFVNGILDQIKHEAECEGVKGEKTSKS